ncbi:uncharacterized protein LOC133818056 [Humulus lupulus]|uniref:uncharacterized protein LOC133818056 n=1 Tax=Humulus lupulus TaxID=3486 RepID=UPI002B4156E8|nr:uncharacterized protein LOC133818056 [Humulus lupulus]
MTKPFEDLGQKDSFVILIFHVDNILIITIQRRRRFGFFSPMAKRKKTSLKPVIHDGDPVEILPQVANEVEVDVPEVCAVSEIAQDRLKVSEAPGFGHSQGDDLGQKGQRDQEIGVEDVDSEPDVRSTSYVNGTDDNEKGGDDDFQSESQHHWQQFRSSKLSFSEPKLEFTEPIFRNGQKLAQVDIEEVKIQSANWSAAVICMVMGANPPMTIFEGFIKRVWGHLGIAQISRMIMGLTLVKFNDEATRDHVLENGILQFDRKPVIVRPWTTDLSAIRLIRSVPLWVRLHDLRLQYWGSKCLSALVSTVGKPLLVDKFTRERSRVQFARVLVEMEITDDPPRSLQFVNEYGQIIEQGIEYEWLPTKCKTCSGFGHSMADCRKSVKPMWVEKGGRSKADSTKEQGTTSEIKNTEEPTQEVGNKEGVDISVIGLTEVSRQEEANVDQSKERVMDDIWHTPKRTASLSKQGLGTTEFSKLATDQHHRTNKYDVLQEQKKVQEIVRSSKIGIGGLLETKLRGNKVREFMDTRFPNWEFYSSPIIEGRLLILWRKGIARLTVLEDSPQLVHCQVQLVGDMRCFWVTFVYGFNTVEKRRSLWTDLTRISLSAKAWIVLGDFNATFSGGDRSGGNAITGNELADAIDWKVIANVQSLKATGSFFTWTNNQEGTARIFSKIDHVFITEEWLDFFPQTLAKFSWEVVSDHCSCIVSNIPVVTMGTKLFKYYNFWANHTDFKQAVLSSWEVPVQATGLRAVFVQLVRLKHRLKRFNRECIGDVGYCYQLASKEFQDAQFQAQANPLDISLHELVVDHFVEHFKNHLGSSRSASGVVDRCCVDLGPKLSIDQQLSLMSPFSNKEIKKAFFSIPSTKTPGPDGFGSSFFKLFWKEIGHDICSAVNHGFTSGKLPKELHETTISLIPKVSNPAKASDFRPIACCSTIYKVMAKLLSSRLALVLPSLIQSNQGAFVRGRTIAHNIMILQDLIKNYGRANTSPRCAIKIDISKAYDTVDWLFLENLLKEVCFPMKFIGWVMKCVQNTNYFLLLNGRVQGNFKGKRGLRKGDPMPPLLFVIIMEYLTRSIQWASRSPLFRFHPLCKSINLINLCFADDIILFCKGNIGAVNVLKCALGVFGEASGLQLNLMKSMIYFGGVPLEDKKGICQLLNLTEGSFPLHYLGVPLRPTKWKHSDCEIIIQKVRTKLFSWSSKHLSYAGRLLLIQSVQFGLCNFWMNVFILPQSIIKEVDKLCRQFLWGASGTRSKLHFASWQQVCRPKAFGGLGLREGSSWNRALLAKYIWAVTNKHDTLWVKWVQHVYLKGADFWNYGLKLDTSSYWRKICHLRNKFSKSEVLAAGCSGKFKPALLYISGLNQKLAEYKKTIWHRSILPKHRFMLWMVLNSYLLTRDNLAKVHMQLSSLLCPVCDIHLESHQHLFFDCCLSLKVLEVIFTWIGFPAWSPLYSAWTVNLHAGFSNSFSLTLNMILAAVVYSIWRNRNRCLHDGYSLTAYYIAK